MTRLAILLLGAMLVGCDMAELMADLIEHLRGELAAADSTNRLEG